MRRRESTTNVAGGSAAHIASCLKGIDFPKSKREVVNFCKDNGGAEQDIMRLKGLDNKKYTGMVDLMKGIGKTK